MYKYFPLRSERNGLSHRQSVRNRFQNGRSPGNGGPSIGSFARQGEKRFTLHL
jgi:hypothetical protein